MRTGQLQDKSLLDGGGAKGEIFGFQRKISLHHGLLFR